jgi:hypothetical protein
VADDLVLTDPWVDLRGGGADQEAERGRFLDEISGEVSDGHPLAGLKFEVVGRSFARDDALIRLPDDRWAVVHVTWTRPERPPWPATEFFESATEVERAIG